jgi:lysyl-tRNA synthetase, class II
MSQNKNTPVQLPALENAIVRILRKRKSSNIVFLTVRAKDSSHQLALQRDITQDYTEIKSVPAGSLLRVHGEWGASENGTPTFFVSRATVLHRYGGQLPDKQHGIGNDQRHLNRTMDWATNDSAYQYMLLGSDLLSQLREVLRKWNFREFNTGVLQRRFEGGFANPFVTTCNTNNQQYYLSLTSELKLKRLVVAGMERVCEIAQSFRNEGLSRVHSPEFTLLEAYAVDMTYLDIMRMVEEMVTSANALVGQVTDQRESFKRLTYHEACMQTIGIADPNLEQLTELFPTQFTIGMPLFTWVMKLLEVIVGSKFIEPTFVTELPAGLSPLVRRSVKDASVTDRAFLFAKGYFICDIYTDENNPEILKRELLAQAKLTGREPDPEYLQCIELGIPPTAGVGLGVNRLHMLLLPDELPHHIRETILYPLG